MSGDSYLTWTQSSANASGTQIVGTVTISASDPGGETVDIAVTAGGSGNGFSEGEKQGAQSNTATATVAATPTITYNGSVISGSGKQATQVVVGQQISLTGSPAGGTWSISGTYWGQWNGSMAGGPTTVGSSSNPIPFYWVASGNYNVTYSVGGNSATGTFSVAGPTVSTNDTVSPSAFLTCETFVALCGEFFAQDTVAPPAGYAGTISYLQVVNSDTVTLTGAGSAGQTCHEPSYAPPMLDGSYPYPPLTSTPTTISTKDFPYVGLGSYAPAGVTGVTRVNSYSMYILWQPSGVGTSFPIPLYSTNWGCNESAAWGGSAWTASGGCSGWSKDGTQIAFERGADGRAMAVLVTMRPDGTLLRQVPFRPAEAHVSGMRFIEGLEWISDRDIVVYGSLNPSTVEYAVVDLQAGKEVRSHLVDGYRWAASPDGSHAAYAGYLPHFTPEAERRPQLCFDRECGLSASINGAPMVSSGGYPGTREHLEFGTAPVWRPDGLAVAIAAESYETRVRTIIVRPLSGQPSRYRLPDGAADPFQLTWDGKALLVISGDHAWQLQPGASAFAPTAEHANTVDLVRALHMLAATKETFAQEGVADYDCWCESCPLRALPRRHGGAPSLDSWWRR